MKTIVPVARYLVPLVVIAMIFPAMSVASPVDLPLTSDTLPVQMGQTGLTPPVGMASAELRESPKWVSGGLVYIIVQSSLYNTIPDSIDLLEYDIENHRNADYDVEILSASWTSHTQVKTALQDGYALGMRGAILIGDIPTPWYHMLNPVSWGENYWETFPIDLFYMDLDGTWGDGTGTEIDPYNTHTAGMGDIEPEIWAGRIYVETLSAYSTETDIIQYYVSKVHDYSLGMTTRQNRAYVFVDDDWYEWADEYGGNAGLAYPNVTLVKELTDTVKATYMNALPQDYEWLSLFSHTGITYHQLIVPTGYHYIYNYEIEAGNCQALFYNLFCCGAADYATDGYIQGYYAFANSGLMAIGSAKTGSMLEFQHFYQPLSEGACIGEAFRDWMEINLNIWGDESKAWFYGMNIAGDPTLEIGGYDVPPMPPSDLTVEHWGPDYNYDVTNEARHLRGVSGEAIVNGLTAYSLGTANSATQGNWAPGNSLPVHLGMRVWKRSSAGTETEITSGSPVATVSRTATGLGYQSATWTPPETSLETTDSIVVRVYGNTAYPPTTLRATFTTGQLGADKLDPEEWIVQYWTRFGSIAQGGSDWFWGTSAYDNQITGFTHSIATSPRDPLDDNTLNWTASPSPDVDQYNVYRSEIETGPYSLVGSSPAGSETYCDTDTGQADGTLWWYIVRAEDAAANEELNNLSVREPASPFLYDRSMAGLSSPWVLLSFPIGATGSPGTVLDDGAYGDGMTTWIVAKTWDNVNKKWLSYRPGGASNTFNYVDNTMGIWLQIVSNGGDQSLTVGSDLGYPDSLNIHLYTGWNLIGWPSATSMSASMIPNVDKVAVYQTEPPYIIDLMPWEVTLSQGNGYWVHVTADCQWTLEP